MSVAAGDYFLTFEVDNLYFSVISINLCINRCCQQEKSIHVMLENGKKIFLKTDSGQRFHVRILTTEMTAINNLTYTFESKHSSQKSIFWISWIKYAMNKTFYFFHFSQTITPELFWRETPIRLITSMHATSTWVTRCRVCNEK